MFAYSLSKPIKSNVEAVIGLPHVTRWSVLAIHATKLPLIYLAKTNSPEYPKNYFKSYCKDVLILAQLAFYFFFSREIVLTILLADQEVKPIKGILEPHKEILHVIQAILPLFARMLHVISIEPVS